MSDTIVTSPTKRSATPNRAELFDVSTGQGGYFTAEQARACGYSWALLSHHVKSGRFLRVRRGLYRIREYPSSPREDVLAAWLAAGKDVAIVSHDSALDLLELSDIIPDAVHLTVPRSRRSLPSAWNVRIHTATQPVAPHERWERDGIAVTSPTRTILDAAELGDDPAQMELAIAQAVERGLATPQELRQAAAERSRRVRNQITNALQLVAA
jgi:predicted transcriptional regulator of viral defense system